MRIGLFVTCLTDTLFPDTGQAVVAVLERLGHQVDFPAAQACCGQMHFNTGYRREAVPMVRGFAAAFGGFEAIVTPSASCASMVREYYPRWPPRPGDAGLARAVAEVAPRTLRAVRVPGRRARGDRRGRVLPAPGDLPPELPLAADAPGRRRAAAAAARGARPGPGRPARRRGLLRVRRHVRGEERRRVGRDAARTRWRRSASSGAEVLCAADNSCLMHIGGALARQRSGVAVMHLAEILARTEDGAASRAPIRARPGMPDRAASGHADLPGHAAVPGRGQDRAWPIPSCARNLAHATAHDPGQAGRARSPSWPTGRSCARPAKAIKDHTLAHLDTYLLRLEEQRHPGGRGGALGPGRRRGQRDRGRPGPRGGRRRAWSRSSRWPPRRPG